MNTTEILVAFGYPIALLAVAFLVERRLGDTEPVFSAPPWARIAVGGATLVAPWLTYWVGHFEAVPGPVDALLSLTLAFALWICADRLVGLSGSVDDGVTEVSQMTAVAEDMQDR